MSLPSWLVDFETTKVAVVRDARLGILWWILASVSVFYVLFVGVVRDKAYIDKSGDFAGSVQIHLLPPQIGDQYKELLGSCMNTTGSFFNESSSWKSQLNCGKRALACSRTQSERFGDFELINRLSVDCLTLDEHDLQKNKNAQDALFVTTKVLENREVTVVSDKSQDSVESLLQRVRFRKVPAAHKQDGSAEHDSALNDQVVGVPNISGGGSWLRGRPWAFTLVPELFRIRFDHSIFAAEALAHATSSFLPASSHEHSGAAVLAESSLHMDGELVGLGAPGSIFPNPFVLDLPREQHDILPLEVLLAAAGVHLDDSLCDVPGHKNETLRDCGAVLHVIIDYTNLSPSLFGTLVNPRYSVRVARLPETEFFATEVKERAIRADGSRDRVMRVRHGVMLRFVQVGVIGRISLQALAVSISSALGLVGLATVVVDQLAIYCFGHGQHYYSGTRDVVVANATNRAGREPGAKNHRRTSRSSKFYSGRKARKFEKDD